MDNVSVEELSKFKIFNGVPRDKLKRVADLVHIDRVNQGNLIIEDGTTGDTIYLLLEGEVEITKDLVLKVSKYNVNERSKILNLYSAKHGLVFGEIALLDENSKRSATVIARTACTLGVILIKDFLKLTEDEIEICSARST